MKRLNPQCQKELNLEEPRDRGTPSCSSPQILLSYLQSAAVNLDKAVIHHRRASSPDWQLQPQRPLEIWTRLPFLQRWQQLTVKRNNHMLRMYEEVLDWWRSEGGLGGWCNGDEAADGYQETGQIVCSGTQPYISKSDDLKPPTADSRRVGVCGWVCVHVMVFLNWYLLMLNAKHPQRRGAWSVTTPVCLRLIWTFRTC